MDFLTDMIPMIECDDIAELAVELHLTQESVNKLKVIIKNAFLVNYIPQISLSDHILSNLIVYLYLQGTRQIFNSMFHSLAVMFSILGFASIRKHQFDPLLTVLNISGLLLTIWFCYQVCMGVVALIGALFISGRYIQLRYKQFYTKIQMTLNNPSPYVNVEQLIAEHNMITQKVYAYDQAAKWTGFAKSFVCAPLVGLFMVEVSTWQVTFAINLKLFHLTDTVHSDSDVYFYWR